MKKIITILTVCVFAIAGTVSAQSAGMSAKSDLRWIVLPNGANNLITIDNKHIVQLVKRGDTFSDVIIKDATGKTTRLLPVQDVITTAPKTESSGSKFRYIYWSNGADIGMVVRKNDAGLFNITLDVPDLATAKTKAGKAQNRRVEVKLSR